METVRMDATRCRLARRAAATACLCRACPCSFVRRLAVCLACMSSRPNRRRQVRRLTSGSGANAGDKSISEPHVHRLSLLQLRTSSPRSFCNALGCNRPDSRGFGRGRALERSSESLSAIQSVGAARSHRPAQSAHQLQNLPHQTESRRCACKHCAEPISSFARSKTSPAANARW